MSARGFDCPIPGCGWSWRGDARPVGHGPEFERRLAQRAGLREQVIAEHEREHRRREERALASARPAHRRGRHLALVLPS